MGFFKRLIDLITMGSEHPIRRLLGYYVALGLLTVLLHFGFPASDRLFSGERPTESSTESSSEPQLLQDGLSENRTGFPDISLPPRLDLALTTTMILFVTLALMLPVSWVYMSARKTPGHSQALVQTLIIMPIVVAGIVLIVRNSLALAFSLAGVVAAVRFRTTLRDARDVVFVFLAIAVGFAAGVQVLTVAVVVSVVFNFVVLLSWHYDFGRSALEPSASSKWAEPLGTLAESPHEGNLPDRDLVIALSQEKAIALAERFTRVRKILGPKGKKPRFNAILTITTRAINESQQRVEAVLDNLTRRWKLDEVVTNEGKPSELYYLVRLRKPGARGELLTAIHARPGDTIDAAELELGQELEAAEELAEKKAEKEAPV
jgi:hypothetical protein